MPPRRPAIFLIFALCCAASTTAFAVLIPADPGTDWYAVGYQDGYAAGLVASEGYQLGYQEGFIAGIPAGREQCRQDPADCSITLNSLLPDAQYGETEPNDSPFNADSLIELANFWGQSYSIADQDWYRIVTTEANTNLTLTFSLPEARETACRTIIRPDGSISFDCSCQQVPDIYDAVTDEFGPALLCSLTGWVVSIRNASNIVIAEFDTGFASVEQAEAGIDYRVTLGLAGTYYVQVRPNDNTTPVRFSYQMYNITAMLEASDYDEPQQNVGYADAEIEPNNIPIEANRVYNTVSMYGIINLQFENAVCNAEFCEYLQNEPDWFRYTSPGSEILQIAFCDRTECSEGAWFFEVYDQAAAAAMSAGESANPLMAFNVEASGDPTSANDGTPGVWQLGLNQSGDYFFQVGLKRKLEASCATWAQDPNNDGIVEAGAAACSCGDGKPLCEIGIANPGSCRQECNTSTTVTDGVTVQEERCEIVCDPCPDGSAGENSGQQCIASCLCTGERGIVELPEGDVSAQYNFTLSTSLQGPRPPQ